VSALAAVAVAAAFFWLRPPWWCVRARAIPTGVSRPSRRVVLVAAGLAAVLSAVTAPAASAIVAWSVAGAVWSGTVMVRRAAWRRRRAAVREETQSAIDALVGELRAGAPPYAALAAVARESELVDPVAHVAASGGDVAAALVAVGRRPGAEPLVAVGQAWGISEACGAPLVAVLDRVRSGTREDAELDREIAAAAAPARATGTLMAAMPPVALGLGSGLGVDPVRILLTTVPGALCLAAGVAFAVAGLAWVDRIAERAEAS